MFGHVEDVCAGRVIDVDRIGRYGYICPVRESRIGRETFVYCLCNTLWWFEYLESSRNCTICHGEIYSSCPVPVHNVRQHGAQCYLCNERVEAVLCTPYPTHFAFPILVLHGNSFITEFLEPGKEV